MANLKDLIVNGVSRFIGKVYINDSHITTINDVAVTQTPKFTDTVTTVSTTGSGNAVTAISASNGALTVTKGSTFSNNAGTITGVTAGTGLSGGGTSGAVTVNHSNSVTAQTTQAIYPIKIDAQGHISAYGTAVTPLTSASTLDATKLSGTIPSGCYTDNDTKNTAGSTDTSSKIFLIGATSQAANPQTYSHDTAYVGTNGHLYSAGKEVLVGGSNAASTVTITPTKTDVYSMTSAGSVTAGTANTPTVINTSKFSGGSFTRGSFSGGSLTFAINGSDTNQLDITFTAATHGNDSFTAASLQSGFYTAGTANTPTAVTLPGRSSKIEAWTGYSAASAAAQTFTGAKS